MNRLSLLPLVLLCAACGAEEGALDRDAPGAQPAFAEATSAPSVQITPSRGPLARTVTVVTGQGFAPGEQVAIFRDTRPFFAYNTDANGGFVGQPHPLIGPAPASGLVTITAVGRSSGRRATTVFTVTP